MPRFHFNLYNSIGYVPDEEGQDLADVEVARREALKGVRSVIADDVMRGRVDLRGRLEVEDGGGGILFVIRFAEAVALCLPEGSGPAAPAEQPGDDREGP